MSKIEVNTVEPQCGTTLTLGGSGDTVALGSGASQTGFGRTGTVDWITTPKVTGDSPITGVTGKGYFLNTTAGTITINLPAGSAGSIVSLADYAATWQTNNVTVATNGAEKIGGDANDAVLNTEGQSVTFVYVDAVQGWINTMDSTSNVRGIPPYVTASGGNQSPTCGLVCGDYKTHIFTGPGTLCVSSGGIPSGSTTVDYVVVAGGGAGGTSCNASGAGAGGFRMSNGLGLPAPTTSPLASPSALPVSAQGYPITVGAGGTSVANPAPGGGSGNTSTFSTVDSAGGGGGLMIMSVGVAGGSGGGGRGAAGYPSPVYPGGAGNTPPVSPPQGFPGGAGFDGVSVNTQGGGGGGAAVAGGNAAAGAGAPGGAGSFMADPFIGPTAPSYGTPGPTGSTRYFAGGGGGATSSPPASTYPGGAGGGGIGGGPTTPAPTRAGVINTGGGGGAGGPDPNTNTGGGSGIVMIRYKFQN